MTKDELETRVRNLRADQVAQGILLDAMLIAMTASARSALKQNFATLSQQALAAAQTAGHGAGDETRRAFSRSVELLRQRLDVLPHS
jgi:hypothetical protein